MWQHYWSHMSSRSVAAFYCVHPLNNFIINWYKTKRTVCVSAWNAIDNVLNAWKKWMCKNVSIWTTVLHFNLFLVVASKQSRTVWYPDSGALCICLRGRKLCYSKCKCECNLKMSVGWVITVNSCFYEVIQLLNVNYGSHSVHLFVFMMRWFHLKLVAEVSEYSAKLILLFRCGVQFVFFHFLCLFTQGHKVD